MCGIAGVLDARGGSPRGELLAAMQAALFHRGPDDSGVFEDGPVGLAFRRLSILDLERGHQPMVSRDGRYAIVFNGEIYNHLDLRSELEAGGARFSTHSDTQTIVEGFALQGADFFRRLNGMFACAIWDRIAGALTLARDPLGIKPLYVHWKDGTLLFASELRALLAAGAGGSLNPAAVADYLAFGYVHAPDTIIAGVEKFPPGHWTTLRPGEAPKPTRFWSLPEAEPSAARQKPDARVVAEELKDLLARCVRDQMLSDVPVGVFLSGGIDSSLVTALMARAADRPVESFSIGFDGGDSVDETRYAESVARFLSTRHQTIRLSSRILDDLDEMVGCLDEPLSDAAVLPTWRLSVEARRRVKVVLTGEGGDELFAGYGRHKAAYVTESVEKLPSWLRPAAIPAARRLGSGAYFKALPLAGPASWAAAETGPRLKSALAALTPEATPPFAPWLGRFSGLRGLNGLLAFDLQTSMADQLLMKVDKTTMQASLEARVPLLDLRLVDFMFRLPASLKIRLFRGKFILREAAAGLLPREVLTRRKHGFILRVQKWMRRPDNALRDQGLGGGALAATGLFRPQFLEQGLSALRSGSPQADPEFFFRLLVLALWLKRRPGTRAETALPRRPGASLPPSSAR